MSKCALGIDLGGSSSKITLIDENGSILFTASREYPSYSPVSGWLEQDAGELAATVFENIRDCIERSGIAPGDVVCVAVDAATHMAVLCDKDDRPIRRIIHWSDTRSSAESRELLTEYSELLAARSVNRVSSAWSLPQLIWLSKHEPELISKVRRIYFAKDYIRHLLTGDFCTDYIEAMGAMLADDHTMQWDRDLCTIARIDVSMLPEIRDPADMAGTVTKEAAAKTMLAEGTPVIVGTTDTVLEVFASGAVEMGCATVKLATAGRICAVTDRPFESPQFFNYRHIVPGLWYPGTGTRSCAASYKWYRDTFGQTEIAEAMTTGKSPYKLLDSGAEQVPAGSDGLFFHPYLLGEMTPYYDDTLRASFTGIRMHHTKGHFSRAVMEGISYSMRDCLEEVKKQNVDVKEYILIGGGAKGPLWRQILANVLDTPLKLIQNNDSSLGSAMLAGTAAGLFSGYADSVKKCVRTAMTVFPDPDEKEVYQKGFEIYKMIQAQMAEVYHRMG